MLIIILPNIDCLNPQKLKATNFKKAIENFKNKEEIQSNQKAYKNQKILHFHSELYIPLELKLSTNLQEHLRVNTYLRPKKKKKHFWVEQKIENIYKKRNQTKQETNSCLHLIIICVLNKSSTKNKSSYFQFHQSETI